MALGCTWGGYAESDVQFSEFFGKNHTIAIRFLMQYPCGYAGSFFSVRGAGKYFVGQGDFQALKVKLPDGQTSGFTTPGQPNLLIVIGSGHKRYTVSDHGWHHVALVRTDHHMQVFIDGLAHPPFSIPTDQLPDGTLRFGRALFELGDVGGQFYGLLDDFALFDTALSPAKIKELAEAKRLTGNESHLQAGFVFRNLRPSSLPPRLRRPLDTHPAARFHEVSDDRNAPLDLLEAPLPLNLPMHLPFAPGEVWRVTQGYNQLLSHHGYAAFCWDFVRDGAIGGSEGEMIYSASGGRVRKVEKDFTNPVPNPGDTNFVSVRQADRLCCDYLHIKTKSALVSEGNDVDFGTHLALVGDIGVKGPHLHMAVSNGEGAGSTVDFITMPAAFSNYEAEVDGDWKLMIRGIPQTDQRVRRPPDEGPIRFTAAWQRDTGPEIQIYGVPYEQYRAKYDSIWNDGWRLTILEAVGVDDHARYTAVWRPTGGGEFQLYGVTSAQLAAEYDTRRLNGWRIDLLTSYVVDGEARYTGVWRPSSHAQRMILGETRTQFDARDAALRERGYVLQRLSTHTIGQDVRYSAVWRQSDEREVTFLDRSEKGYRTEYGDRYEFGFRLKLLSVTVVNGVPRYSGSWIKHASPVEEERWHAVSYGDLRARYDVLWQTGWRLKLLEPYVP
jgi:murein DD-endopeptidase MepM/ murein hydrolase activator NlpD